MANSQVLRDKNIPSSENDKNVSNRADGYYHRLFQCWWSGRPASSSIIAAADAHGEKVVKGTGSTAVINAIALCGGAGPHINMWSACEDGSLACWDLDRGDISIRSRVNNAHRAAAIQVVKMLSNGLLVTAGSDKQIALWDPRLLPCEPVVENKSKMQSSPSTSIGSSATKKGCVWQVADAHADEIFSLLALRSWGSDSCGGTGTGSGEQGIGAEEYMLVSGGADEEVKVWDFRIGGSSSGSGSGSFRYREHTQ